MTPRYPVYVISKGRSDCCLTARFLVRDETPFRLVVEPQEREAYAKEFGEERLLVLPFSNLGRAPDGAWVATLVMHDGRTYRVAGFVPATRHLSVEDRVERGRTAVRKEVDLLVEWDARAAASRRA